MRLAASAPLLALALCAAAMAFTGSRTAPAGTALQAAAQDYDNYCARCHGTNGRGDGRRGQALAVPPADLTHIADRNGGVFPANVTRDYVDGRGMPRHAEGSAMPQWGEIFRLSIGDEGAVMARVDGLVDYLETMQE